MSSTTIQRTIGKALYCFSEMQAKLKTSLSAQCEMERECVDRIDSWENRNHDRPSAGND